MYFDSNRSLLELKFGQSFEKLTQELYNMQHSFLVYWNISFANWSILQSYGVIYRYFGRTAKSGLGLILDSSNRLLFILFLGAVFSSKHFSIYAIFMSITDENEFKSRPNFWMIFLYQKGVQMKIYFVFREELIVFLALTMCFP